jgi:hypothetical protein
MRIATIRMKFVHFLLNKQEKNCPYRRKGTLAFSTGPVKTDTRVNCSRLKCRRLNER